jgi:ABC-type transporter Mla subunit MlaD
MKLRIVMPLVLSAAALTGCQQLNDGVNTVNGAISSSLSSVGKALGELPPLKTLARYRQYLALVLSAKTMKKMQWQQKRNGQAKGSLLPMPLFLKLRRAEVPAT